MAAKNKAYIKTGHLSKPEFMDALAKISEARSVTGSEYRNIAMADGIICGDRQLTGKPFRISADALYRAYCELDVFNTVTLKRYVYRVQSPALALLFTARIIAPAVDSDLEFITD